MRRCFHGRPFGRWARPQSLRSPREEGSIPGVDDERERHGGADVRRQRGRHGGRPLHREDGAGAEHRWCDPLRLQHEERGAGTVARSPAPEALHADGTCGTALRRRRPGGGDIASAPWVAPEPAAAEVRRRGDPAEAGAIAAEMGRQLLRAGINTDFAPVLDTGFGAAIGNRSYGEDPELVARMGTAAVEGFEEAGVVSAAKHFPNHGPARTDSHVSLPVIRHDTKTLHSYDLPPFEAAVDAGVPMVMAGHLVYPAVDPHDPASLSKDAISMLRGDLGFRGVVVTDDLAMAGAKRGGTTAEAAVEAVEAGADLLVVSSPQQQADAYDAVVAAIESGEIPRARIRKSVERLLEVKER